MSAQVSYSATIINRLCEQGRVVVDRCLPTIWHRYNSSTEYGTSLLGVRSQEGKYHSVMLGWCYCAFWCFRRSEAEMFWRFSSMAASSAIHVYTNKNNGVTTAGVSCSYHTYSRGRKSSSRARERRRSRSCTRYTWITPSRRAHRCLVADVDAYRDSAGTAVSLSTNNSRSFCLVCVFAHPIHCLRPSLFSPP